MTRRSDKATERFYVEQAAECLGTSWSVGPDREEPDFVVTENAHCFGLEVSSVFTGAQNRRDGSSIKRQEAHNQQTIDALRHEYEATTNTPLRVRFVGNICPDVVAAVVPRLFAADLSTKPIGYSDVINWDNRLRVHVTRALRAEWFSVNDRVGWVDRDPGERIDGAIEGKLGKLSRYRENAGPDVRLLLVADRIHSSGKLVLQEPVDLDKRGFDVVYFFSYPESVTVFT